MFAGDRVTARVSGRHRAPHRVKLWRGSRGKAVDCILTCNCATGREETFCKHCVAVGNILPGGWLAGPDGQPAKLWRGRGKPFFELRRTRGNRNIEGWRTPTGSPWRFRARQLRTAASPIICASSTKTASSICARSHRLRRHSAAAAAPGNHRRAASRPTRGARPPPRPRTSTPTAKSCARPSNARSTSITTPCPTTRRASRKRSTRWANLLASGHAAAVIELAEFALIELDKANEMVDGGDGRSTRLRRPPALSSGSLPRGAARPGQTGGAPAAL